MSSALTSIPRFAENATPAPVKANGTGGSFGPPVECGSTKQFRLLRSPLPSVVVTSAALGGALGTYGSIVSPGDNAAPKSSASAIVQRFVLQSAARRLLPSEGVSGCLRRRQGGKDKVELWYLPETASAKFGGLQTCSSVWACPVCAAKISERRRIEVRSAIDAWAAVSQPNYSNPSKQQGGDVFLLTLTVRHMASDSLEQLLDGLKDALRRCHQGKQGQKFADLGVCGSITATELTWGEKSGYHPHLHMLLFVKPGSPFERILLHYRKQWGRAVVLAGLRPVNDHGVDMTFQKADIADYVVKIGGWDIEHELTKSPVKKGREGRYSPLQLLASFADFTLTGDCDHPGREHGRIWQHYAHCMKGRHQLQWSRGLRKSLGLGAEKSDELLAEEKEKLGILLAELTAKEWATVLHFDKRAELLVVGATGDPGKVADFLTDLDWTLNNDEEERILLSLRPRSLSNELAELALLNHERDIVRLLRETDAAMLGLSLAEYEQWQRGGELVMGGGKWSRRRRRLPARPRTPSTPGSSLRLW